MKNILTLIIIAVAVVTIVSCKSDEVKSQDCLSCYNRVSKFQYTYCYTEGDDFYTVSGLGDQSTIKLQGEEWEVIKVGLSTYCK